MSDYKVGDKLKTECISCGAEEIWEIESITNEKYKDGIFKTYNLKSVKHCFGIEVITSAKDCKEVMQFYKLN